MSHQGSNTATADDLLTQLDEISRDPTFGQPTAFQQDILSRIAQLFENPLESGIFNALLDPTLQALEPSEELARRNLTDQFRQVGGLNSGAFLAETGNVERDILQNRSQATSNLARESLAQLLGSLTTGFQLGDTARTGEGDRFNAILQLLGGVQNQQGLDAEIAQRQQNINQQIFAQNRANTQAARDRQNNFGFSATTQAVGNQARNTLFGPSAPSQLLFGGGNPGRTLSERLDFSRTGFDPTIPDIGI